MVCEVTPDDGLESGTPELSTALEISNSIPTVAAVSVTSPATVNTEIICAATGVADNDIGDTLTTAYSWTVAGQPVVPASPDRLAAGTAVKGEEVICEVTVSDTFDTSSPLQAAVTIDNSAPVAAAGSFTVNGVVTTQVVIDLISQLQGSAIFDDDAADTLALDSVTLSSGAIVSSVSAVGDDVTLDLIGVPGTPEVVVLDYTITDGTDTASSTVTITLDPN